MKLVCYECGKVLEEKDCYVFYDWTMCKVCFESWAYE